MNISKILSLLDTLDIVESKPETIDIKTDEGYDKFIELLDNFNNSSLEKSLFELVFGEDSIEDLKELATTIHDEAQKENKSKKQTKLIEDKSVKESEEIIRPSSKLTTEQGLQIHKLVQEYVDTMIRPYNKGQMSNKQINDAYAGLYEFAAWILNK